VSRDHISWEGCVVRIGHSDLCVDCPNLLGADHRQVGGFDEAGEDRRAPIAAEPAQDLCAGAGDLREEGVAAADSRDVKSCPARPGSVRHREPSASCSRRTTPTGTDRDAPRASSDGPARRPAPRTTPALARCQSAGAGRATPSPTDRPPAPRQTQRSACPRRGDRRPQGTGASPAGSRPRPATGDHEADAAPLSTPQGPRPRARTYDRRQFRVPARTEHLPP
jgi:hypothetical protein